MLQDLKQSQFTKRDLSECDEKKEELSTSASSELLKPSSEISHSGCR